MQGRGVRQRSLCNNAQHQRITSSSSGRLPAAADQHARSSEMMKHIVIVLLMLLAGCTTSTKAPKAPQSDEVLITRWRVKQVTFEEVDSGRTPYDKPTGQQWDEFKARARAGDELWYFCSPGPTWTEMMGWRGYAIYRAGRLIAEYTTAEN